MSLAQINAASEAGTHFFHLKVTTGDPLEDGLMRPTAELLANWYGAILSARGDTPQILGCPPAAVAMRSVETLFIGSAWEKAWQWTRPLIYEVRASGAALKFESEAQHRNGLRVPVELELTLLAASVEGRPQRHPMANTSQVSRTPLHVLLSAQEDERRRFSKELPRRSMPAVGGLRGGIGSTRTNATVGYFNGSSLERLETRLARTCEETRHLAYRLYPATLEELGLERSLRTLFDEFCERAAIHGEFHSILSGQIPLDVGSTIYRTAEEGLGNIAKHAQAKNVLVTLVTSKNKVVFSIKDDGAGFDFARRSYRRGLGIVSMRERATMGGGTLLLESQEGAGTLVQLTLPLSRLP